MPLQRLSSVAVAAWGVQTASAPALHDGIVFTQAPCPQLIEGKPSSAIPLQSSSSPLQASPLGSTWPLQVDQMPAAQVCVPAWQVPWFTAPAGQLREGTESWIDESVSSQSRPAQPVPTPNPSPSPSVQLGQLRTQVPAGHVQLPHGALPKWVMQSPVFEQTKPASPASTFASILESVAVSGGRSAVVSIDVSIFVSMPVSVFVSIPESPDVPPVAAASAGPR